MHPLYTGMQYKCEGCKPKLLGAGKTMILYKLLIQNNKSQGQRGTVRKSSSNESHSKWTELFLCPPPTLSPLCSLFSPTLFQALTFSLYSWRASLVKWQPLYNMYTMEVIWKALSFASFPFTISFYFEYLFFFNHQAAFLCSISVFSFLFPPFFPSVGGHSIF